MERENIDPERTKNDLVVGHYTNEVGKFVVGRVEPREGEPNWGTVEQRIERVNAAQKAAGKRATRKDAVVMADVVVTLPENVRKGDEDRFFRLTYWYLSKKFGVDNMLGGFVHKDEVLKDGTPARDHMHVPFTPILDGRFNYKKMCPRSFYQSMHKELGDYLERRMGYRPNVELDEKTRAQRVYADKSADIDKVRGAVDAAVVQPAQAEAERIVAAARERAAAMVDDAEERKAKIAEEERAAMDRLRGLERRQREEQQRLERLRRRGDEVAGRVDELRAVAADVRGFEDADKPGKREILDRISSRCDSLRERVVEVAAEFKKLLREFDERIEFRRVQAARRENAKASRTPQDAISRARAASAAMRSGSVSQPQRSYRGRAR